MNKIYCFKLYTTLTRTTFKTIIFLLILIKIFSIGIENIFTFDPPSGNITIISITYYPFSSLYPPNTLVLLFNAHRNLSRKQEWYCETQNNFGEKLVSPIRPKDALLQIPQCQMQAFASSCDVVSNPIYFALKTDSKSPLSIQLPFRNAVYKKYPLVSCVSPLFFNEKWQLNILSIETYAYFGVNKQIYYYMSVVGNGYTILQEYEKAGLIILHPWVVPDVDNGNHRTQLVFRNQETSHIDCFLKYRESAEFIIIHDPDDILIPANGKQLYPLISNIFNSASNIASLVFNRYNVGMNIAKNLNDVSWNLTQIKDIKVGTKALHSTSVVYTVGAHFGIKTKKGFNQTEINESYGFFLHTRNATIDNNTRLHPKYQNLAQLVNNEEFKKMESWFSKRRSIMFKNPKISNFTTTNYYYEIIDRCYEKMFYQPTIGINPCPTHFKCLIPSIKNLKCHQAEQFFVRHELNSLIVYFGVGVPYTTIKTNGCSL